MPWSKIGNLKGPGSLVDLGTYAVAETAALALAVGIHKVNIAVPGLLVSDRVLLSPLTANYPNGYMVGQPVVKAPGSLDVLVYSPAMIINASYSMQVRVLVLRS